MISLILALEGKSKYLEKVLEETKEIRSELIVVTIYDLVEEDINILKNHPCKLMKLDKVPIEYLINEGIKEAKEPWVLVLTDNEFLDSLALDELKNIQIPEDTDAYAFRRKNFLKASNGNILLFFNFPDPRVRLFKNYCRFDPDIYSITGWSKCRYFPRGHIIHDRLHQKLDLFFRPDLGVLKLLEFR